MIAPPQDPRSYDVLVVDDSAVMRRMLVRVLGMSGLPIGAVHEAGNGLEALGVLAVTRIGLALVDINMPGMSGDELIDRIRADRRLASLPIVVVSTERSETRVASFAARGAAYVGKPFTPEQIRTAALEDAGAAHA